WLPVVGTFYGVADEPWLTHNTPLWFLPCLFVVEMFYWVIRRELKTPLPIACGLLLCSAAGYWLSLHEWVRIPWGADVALSAVMFYGAGNLSRYAVQAHAESPRHRRIWTSSGMLVLAAAAMWWGFGFVNMSENVLGPGYLQFYAAAFGGILASIVVAQSVPANRFVRWLGRNTIVILALQIPCYGLVKAAQVYGLGIGVEATQDSLLWGLLHTIAIVVLLVPVIYAIDRWAPFLKGQRRMETLRPAIGGVGA
ncbi:MAG: acyltransferase family protein, partial [Planctomycetaceae bacterium]